MRKSLRALLCASAFLCLASIASAGANGDYGLGHCTVLSLSKFTSVPGVIDSAQWYLEGSQATVQSSTVYDTTNATDTTMTISLADNAAFGAFSVPLGNTTIPDSLWVGRLILHFTTALATDTVFASTDVSPDGGPYSWLSQVSTGTGGLGCLLKLSSARDGAQTVCYEIWTAPAKTKLATIASGTARAFFGAQALRFRLALGTTTAPKKIDRAEWVYVSTNPNAGK